MRWTLSTSNSRRGYVVDLKGFEWDKEESWTKLIVHLSKDAGVAPGGGSKKKKKQAADE